MLLQGGEEERGVFAAAAASHLAEVRDEHAHRKNFCDRGGISFRAIGSRYSSDSMPRLKRYEHCDTLPETQKDKHEKRSMVRPLGQPPYIDVIDVARHAPLRPWKTPVSSDDALRH